LSRCVTVEDNVFDCVWPVRYYFAVKQALCIDCNAVLHYCKQRPPLRCEPCIRERKRYLDRVWCAANKEKKRVSSNAWNTANKERRQTKARIWYENNRTNTTPRSEEVYQKALAANRVWRQANIDKARASSKAWRDANPDARKAAKYRRLSRLRNAEGSWTAAEWRERLALYGGVCPCCGSSEDLTIDHIVPIAWGGNNFVWNLQPLCKRTNEVKNDKAIADYLPWNGEGPRLAFYEYLGPAPRRKRRINPSEPSRTPPTQQPQTSSDRRGSSS